MLPPPPTQSDGSIKSENISFAPAADWVTQHEIDAEYRSPVESQETVLIASQQHHVTRREVHHRTARRLESLTAVQHGSQWRWDFDPSTQHLIIHSLVVRRDGAAVEHASQSRIRILHREENLERFEIDGYLSVVVLFEDVRVGDIIDASLTVRTTHRIFPDHFSLYTAIPTGAYTRLFYVSIRFPDGHPMKWRTDSVKLQLNERATGNGEREWNWQLERLKPRMPEPNMPGWYFHGRIIQASDFPSWEFIAKRMNDAWVEDFENPEIQRFLDEASPLPTKIERVEKALRLVQDDIRYLSVNTDFGGQIPANPGASLKRRFGDCKDKSFLLVHLLRRLGVPARPVLVNASLRAKVRDLLPTPGAFNHVIIEFELENRRLWVDPTIPLQGGGPMGRTIPHYEVGLPLGPRVEDIERVVPPTDSGTYSLREVFKTTRVGTSAQVQVQLVLTGSHADQYRYQFAFDTVSVVARKRLELYQSLHRDARRDQDIEWQDDREANKLEVSEFFHLPYAFFPADRPEVCATQLLGHAVHSAISFPNMPKRQHPLALLYPLKLEHRIEYDFETLTDQWAASVQTSTEALRFDAKMNRAGFKTTFHFTYQTYADHVPEARYGTHLAKVKDVLANIQFPVLAAYPRTVSVAPPNRRFPKSERKTADAPTGVQPPEPLPATPALALETLAANRFAPETPASQSPNSPKQDAGISPSGRTPHSKTRVSRSRRSNSNSAALVSVGIFVVYILIRLLILVSKS
jgi:hypothetical protein